MIGIWLSFALLLALPEVGAQESNPMLSNGLKLLNTPYVAYTLEGNSEEELVVNCDEVDCNVRWKCTGHGSLSHSRRTNEWGRLYEEPVNIRYRNGQINGYTSRLHYMTDWINDNVQKGLIEDVTAQYSPSTQTVNLSFMSSHPNYTNSWTLTRKSCRNGIHWTTLIGSSKFTGYPRTCYLLKGYRGLRTVIS